MNTSWSPLKLVNTYGAFGSIGKVRTEVGDHPSPPRPSFHTPHPCPCDQVTASCTISIAIAIALAIGHPAYLQVIIQGTSDGVNWLPYEFPCKPGDVSRRPCTIAPYHYRMDWKMYVCVCFACHTRAFLVNTAVWSCRHCLAGNLWGFVTLCLHGLAGNLWGFVTLCLHCLHQVVCSNDGTTL